MRRDTNKAIRAISRLPLVLRELEKPVTWRPDHPGSRRPWLTGSATRTNTMGVVRVSPPQSSAHHGNEPPARTTSVGRPTSSAAWVWIWAGSAFACSQIRSECSYREGIVRVPQSPYPGNSEDHAVRPDRPGRSAAVPRSAASARPSARAPGAATLLLRRREA